MVKFFKKKCKMFLHVRRNFNVVESSTKEISFNVLLILILSLSGCAKSAKEQKVDTKKHSPPSVSVGVVRQFEAEVEGIECALCAQDVVDMFKAIDGVQGADFVMSGTDYEQGYIRFAYDVSNKNLDLRALDEQLQDEGFDLLCLDGSFYIEPFYHEGKQFVEFDRETAMPFCYGNNINAIKQMVKKHDDRMLFAQGKVKKNIEEGTFFFTLLS